MLLTTLLTSYMQKLKGKSVQELSDYARDEFLRKISATPPFSSMLHAVLPVPQPKKWVFIVGCYNSGTSLLLKTLASHPDISGLDEGVSFTPQLVTPEDLGWTRMWSKVLEEMRAIERNTPPDAKKVKQDWGLHLDTRKSVLIEKSIANSIRIHWLQENFENAHFIFLVRNGYATAEGIRRKVKKRNGSIPTQYGDTYPIALCAEQWVINNQLIEQDLSTVANFKRVRYEDFCENPKEMIETLWRFMGLEPVSEWFAEEQTWKVHEKNLNIQNLNAASIARLSVDDIQSIETVAADVLQLYNYPLLSEIDRYK